MTTNTLVPQTLLNRQQAASSLSISERTISAIPVELLPIVRIGRAVRYRVVDLDRLAERLAAGEISIGPVNG